MDDSQAVIKISRLDHSYYGLNDRLVTLTGTLDEQMRALELILLKLSEDTLYSQTMTVPYTYAGMTFMISVFNPAVVTSSPCSFLYATFKF